MLPTIKSVLLKIYQFISYYGLDDSTSNIDRDFKIILNQYCFIISIIFFIQAVFTFRFLGLELDVIFLFILSFFSFFLIFFSHIFFKNKLIFSSLFIFLTAVVTYYASITGIESGCYIYYFTILSALPIFYSTKKDFLYISIIVLFVLCCFYFSAYKNFTIMGVEAQKNHIRFRYEFLIINISCNLSLLIINYLFVEEKRKDYYQTLNRNIYIKEKIENLTNEIKSLRQIVSKEELSNEKFKDLLQSISLNEFLFLEKFERIFPYFKNNLLDSTKVSLTSSELSLCAILKLGLSTKEIAIHTNSSLKAIEGRKYRLRKKLSISSEEDLTIWFSNI